MAIIDVTVIPLGTENPSISGYVAEIQKILEIFQKQQEIEYQLTPMNTIIEGELPILFEVIQDIHEVLFTRGIQRIATNIRIDDRKDKKSEMKNKLRNVYNKM
ncbi:MTH1187 family thiamine-binding protein [Priestia megaterium]|uniref:MTH1187 family thiamine-binding protein n=1 Tax=Priestia megaterium TaxID=1404 RepID=UPI003A812D3E